MICRRCSGEGEIRLHVCGTQAGCCFREQRAYECPDCGGRGTIPDAQWVRQERGRLLREDRVRRGVTLRQEARQRGMTMQALSALEWGKNG